MTAELESFPVGRNRHFLVHNPPILATRRGSLVECEPLPFVENSPTCKYYASVPRRRRERSDRLAVLGVFRPAAMLNVRYSSATILFTILPIAKPDFADRLVTQTRTRQFAQHGAEMLGLEIAVTQSPDLRQDGTAETGIRPPARWLCASLRSRIFAECTPVPRTSSVA